MSTCDTGNGIFISYSTNVSIEHSLNTTTKGLLHSVWWYLYIIVTRFSNKHSNGAYATLVPNKGYAVPVLVVGTSSLNAYLPDRHQPITITIFCARVITIRDKQCTCLYFIYLYMPILLSFFSSLQFTLVFFFQLYLRFVDISPISLHHVVWNMILPIWQIRGPISKTITHTTLYFSNWSTKFHLLSLQW